MKFHKYYFGFYEHYEILDDNHVECVIKDTTSNKYYQKSYEFVQDKFSGICLTEIKWSIKDILIIILIVLSIPILIVMLYQSINIDVDETFEPTLILMLSILIHELGHSTALRLFGKKAVSYKFKFKGGTNKRKCQIGPRLKEQSLCEIIDLQGGRIFMPDTSNWNGCILQYNYIL